MYLEVLSFNLGNICMNLTYAIGACIAIAAYRQLFGFSGLPQGSGDNILYLRKQSQLISPIGGFQFLGECLRSCYTTPFAVLKLT